MTEQTIRILIADDHPVVRKGIRALLSTEPGLEVVGEATDGEQAVTKALTLKPDVILMDLSMPRKDGVQAISEIRQEIPEVKILVLTSFAEDKRVIADSQVPTFFRGTPNGAPHRSRAEGASPDR